MRRHLTGPRSAGIAGTLLLVVASVATVVGLAVVLGAALGDDGEARVPVVGAVDVAVPAGVTTFSGEASTVVQVAGLPLGLRLFAVLGIVLVCSSLVVGALALRSVMTGIHAGTPFAGRPGARLTLVAGTVFVGAVAAPLVEDATAWVLLDRVDLLDGPFRPGLEVPWTALLVTLLVLAVAAAFGQGSRQTRELAGLV